MFGSLVYTAYLYPGATVWCHEHDGCHAASSSSCLSQDAIMNEICTTGIFQHNKCALFFFFLNKTFVKILAVSSFIIDDHKRLEKNNPRNSHVLWVIFTALWKYQWAIRCEKWFKGCWNPQFISSYHTPLLEKCSKMDFESKSGEGVRLWFKR